MIDTALIRAKVLEQAVYGELSREFDSNDDSLDELTNNMGKDVNESDSEAPYELPEGWHWIALSDLGSDDKHAFADGPFGSNLKKEHYTENEEVRIIQLSNVGELGWKNDNVRYTTYEHLETIQRSEVKAGNIVIAKMMPAGRAIIVPDVNEKYVLSSDCVKFVPCELLNTKYLCYAINSSMFRKQVLQDVHGIGRERTSLSKLKTYLLPIPCKAEQDYIVDKIDKAYEQLEILDILQAQYSSDLEILKSKIIDAGIQGKLTEQLPGDGTAEELLEQIEIQKNEILKLRKGRTDKKIKDVDGDFPYVIPNHWKWIRFGNIGLFKKGPFGSALTKSMFVPKGDNTVKVYEQQHAINKDNALGTYYITREYFDDSMSGFEVLPGDIIVSCAGTIGETYIMPEGIEQGIINQALMRVTLAEGINRKFFQFYFDANLKKSAQEESNGSAIKNIPPFDVMKNWYFPIPPLEEQERIVEKIENILAIL